LVTEDVDTNIVHFGEIPEETIDALILDGTMFTCAGGLMVEHPLVVDHITGLDGTLEGVMGLSKISFMRVLLKTVQDSQSA
jgi:septum formation protein